MVEIEESLGVTSGGRRGFGVTGGSWVTETSKRERERENVYAFVLLFFLIGGVVN